MNDEKIEMKPLVSIIIPFKDRVQLLIEALDSVASQSYKNIEVILVDDGSQEDCKNTLNEYCGNRFSYQILRNDKNLGPGPSRQRGLEASRGDYLIYLDSDDLLASEMVETCLRFMNENKNISMAYVESREFTTKEDLKDIANLKTRQRSNQSRSKYFIEDALSQNRVWDTSACFWRRMDILKFNKWLPIRHYEDYAYDAHIDVLNLQICGLCQPLCFYRNHKESLSREPHPRDYFKVIMLLNVSNYVMCSNLMDEGYKKIVINTIRCKTIRFFMRFPKVGKKAIVSEIIEDRILKTIIKTFGGHLFCLRVIQGMLERYKKWFLLEKNGEL